MSAMHLLLETLDDLIGDDFDTFKWHLENGGEFKAIPRSQLENAKRINTVTKMIDTYGDETAVKIAVDVLQKMGNNNAAQKLKNKYAARENTAAPSTSTSAAAPPAAPVAPPAAPASIMAQDGAFVFAPNVTSSNTGEWNIKITK